MFLPRLPHADVKLLLFAPDATRSVKEKHKHNKHKKQKNKQGKTEDDVFPFVGLFYVKLCDTAALVH